VISNGTITGVAGDAISVPGGAGGGEWELDHLVVSHNSGAGFDPGATDARFEVRNCEFDHNGAGIAVSESHFVIVDSTFVANGIAAFLDLANGEFVHNAVVRNTNGVLSNDSIRSAPIIVQGNVFERNTGYGISYGQGFANGPVPQIIANVFVNNGVGLLWDTDSRNPGLVSGTVQANLFIHNAGDGAEIRVTAGSSVTVARNVAFLNGTYGIEAYNVIDGGHNVAAFNGKRAQCLGVVCRRFW
jgi:hypothetical protein